MAAMYEHFHVVKYLIEQGEVDPNIENRTSGRNILEWNEWLQRRDDIERNG